MASRFVNLRLGEKLVSEIDSIVANETFESRTEFIKETLRKAVEDRKRAQLFESFQKRFGEGKRLGIKAPSAEELEKIKDSAAKKILKKKGFI
jgi:Arc/MetJ-type ribon-helix-helix transcriptional regulator